MSEQNVRDAIRAAFERAQQPPAPGFPGRMRAALTYANQPRQRRQGWFWLAGAIAVLLAAAMVAGLLSPRLMTPRQPAGRTPPPSATTASSNEVLRMVDGQNGWAFKDSRAYRTTDAGAHWTDAGAVPAVPPGQTPTVAVWGMDIAWILGPTNGATASDIYQTVDAGATWQRIGTIGMGLPGRQLTFIDPRQGWLLLGWAQGTAGKETAVLYGTTDGGRTWGLVAETPIAFHLPGQPLDLLPPSCYKTGVTFADPATGWMTGDCDGGAASPFLYRTLDGGRTWQKQAIPGFGPGRSAWLSPVVFVTRSVGHFTAFHTTGSDTIVYATHDGGGTWTVAAQVAGGRANAIAAISPRKWVAATGDRRLAVIDNARVSYVTTDVGPGGIQQLWFGNDRDGLAVTGDGRFLRTTDGGHTWRPVALS